MDLSSRPSPDEARIIERQLYRPGQTPPAPKTPASARPRMTPALSTAKGPSGVGNAKTSRTKHILAVLLLGVVGYYLLYGNSSQRRKILVGLGAAAWLLLLGGISYCIFLPDPVAQIKEGFAEMRNLSPEQRREKSREIRSLMRDLTPRQQMLLGRDRQLKEREKLAAFIKLSPTEQVAKLKKEILDQKARNDQRAARRAANGGNNRRGGGNAQGAGGGQGRNAGGQNGRGGSGTAGAGRGAAAGGTGAGPGGVGPGGMASGRGSGGPGGRGGDANVRQRAGLDRSDPEARAMRTYERGMNQVVRQQLGLPAGGGGRGGFGGGFGGGGRRGP